jgi:hypothetical protein
LVGKGISPVAALPIVSSTMGPTLSTFLGRFVGTGIVPTLAKDAVLAGPSIPPVVMFNIFDEILLGCKWGELIFA